MYILCFVNAIIVFIHFPVKLPTRDTELVLFVIGFLSFYTMFLLNFLHRKKIKQRILVINKHLPPRFGSRIERFKIILKMFLLILFFVILTMMDLYVNDVKEEIYYYCVVNIPFYINLLTVFSCYTTVSEIRKEFGFVNGEFYKILNKKFNRNAVIFLSKKHNDLCDLSRRTFKELFAVMLIVQLTSSFMFVVCGGKLLLRFVFLRINRPDIKLNVVSLGAMVLFFCFLGFISIATVVLIWTSLQIEVSNIIQPKYFVLRFSSIKSNKNGNILLVH